MKKLLQINFSFNGPFGEDMSNGLKALAESINQEPGFIWKIWTENEKGKEAGGIYLFEDEASAQSYLEMHTARLKQFGVEEVHTKIFDVNVPLTEINKGSLG
ncbi:monooxygenase [Vibrio japonicus]|uniref:Monooxygenase n=1 Tax=Vibrio japonicus TaxID=1824638 RepID=A0ABY5LPH1_9VIBR|nr:monooxygenase [Vibrio japonicus]UUM32718.1 monooxygenase [Vibrio japonicus]